MIVLDSSAVVEWLLGLPLAGEVADRIEGADSLHVPALLDVEVAHVVRRYALAGDISARTGERALAALGDLDAVRYTHDSLLPLIWRFRHSLTAYDAVFVALGALLGAPLVTLDARLARAPWSPLSGSPVVIELLGEPH